MQQILSTSDFTRGVILAEQMEREIKRTVEVLSKLIWRSCRALPGEKERRKTIRYKGYYWRVSLLNTTTSDELVFNYWKAGGVLKAYFSFRSEDVYTIDVEDLETMHASLERLKDGVVKFLPAIAEEVENITKLSQTPH